MAYCTSDDFKLAGGWATSDTGDDSAIEYYIPIAQQMIDTHCDRTFEVVTTTDQSDSDVSSIRYFDAEADIVDTYTLLLDKDLCKILSISVDGVAISSDSYVTEPRNDIPYYGITILSNSSDDWDYGTDAENAIAIDGFWAYSTSAPADIKSACVILTNWLFKQRNSDLALTAPIIDAQSGVTVLPVQTPTVVRSTLSRYKRQIFKAI
jgi:hypothetical protein